LIYLKSLLDMNIITFLYDLYSIQYSITDLFDISDIMIKGKNIISQEHF